uniref:Uncharacterized protein n=1 Tax=Arundo donax TaxID=35708 RepID=A0A0A8Z867_ARUDO
MIYLSRKFVFRFKLLTILFSSFLTWFTCNL